MSEHTIDLHAHTTASDGDHTPTQLVELARAVGLTSLAITDHDTTEGISEAVKTGEALGVEIVPGIELSAEITRGQCHLLGLFIDPKDVPLQSRLKEIVEKRNRRNEEIVEKIQGAGIDFTLEEVKEAAGGEIVARPHFARLLIQKGVYSTVQEAFDLGLARGGRFYVERARIGQAEAISLIHGAGGAAFLAHPNNLKLSPEATEVALLNLRDQGLDGIEARYNLHSPEDNARYLDFASRNGLLTSGGSDYHGFTVKPRVFLGHVEGEKPAPASMLEEIRARHFVHARSR